MYISKVRLLLNQSLRFPAVTRIYPTCSYVTTSKKAPDPQEINENEPIKFTTSRAGKHKALISRQGPPNNRLSYEPSVILFSLTIFFIYFAFLREENDLDEELGRSLYSRVEGLEEVQLKTSIAYNKQYGKDTKALENRLREVQAEKQAKAQADEKLEFQ